MLKKIVIHIDKSFTNDTWRLIFKLYDYCHKGDSTFSALDFDTLEKKSLAIRYYNDDRQIDAIAIYGNELDYCILNNELSNCSEFFISVVYVKEDAGLDNPDYLPLITWLTDSHFVYDKNDFSFGVDITSLKKEDKRRYIYTIGQRISIIDSLPTPRASKRCIYYIDNYDEGKITKSFPYSLSHDAPGSSKSISLPIDEDSLVAYFSPEKKKIDNPGQKILIDSIGKIDVHVSGTSNFLEEWFVKSYLENNGIKGHVNLNQHDNSIHSLHEYCNNIYELVQNIIFHTKDKTGWLLARFYKKKDIRIDLRAKIPFFEDYSDNDRFLVFDLCDTGEYGIVKTFGDNNLSLLSFFDPHEILPDKCDQLSIRYAAHLGIKTFVTSIINNGGYFFCESNNTIDRKSRIESQLGVISEITSYDNNECGTVYRAILPVRHRIVHSEAHEVTLVDDYSVSTTIIPQKKQPRFVAMQPGTHVGEHGNDLLSFRIENIKMESIDSDGFLFESKAEQKNFIRKVGNSVIGTIERNQGINIGLDFSDWNGTYTNLVFKLLAYVRLNLTSNKQPETIVCYNISDELYDNLLAITTNHCYAVLKKKQPIWSDEFAIVLMAKDRIKILCGETKESYCFVNQGLSRYFTLLEENNEFNGVGSIANKKLEKFIRPYDIYVGSPSLFVNTVGGLLNKKIEDVEGKQTGCLVNMPARLGEKIYIDNFYQADHLFQESYYAERFALCIAQGFLKSIQNIETIQTRNIIILSYNPYSKLLAECVKKSLESNGETALTVAGIVIGTDDPESSEMIFRTSGEKQFSGKYHLITIVPIASTLTTFEKLRNNFQRYCHKEQFSIQIDFEYKHCSILVRDIAPKKRSGCSSMESEWNWIWVNDRRRHVVTQSKQTIHYLVSVETSWHQLIDKDTFPQSDLFYEEKFILRTHNASLNVKNILGYPDVFLSQDIDCTESRLKEMKDFILFGHIIHNGKHHRYYFDVPKYIERYQNEEGSELRKWISQITTNSDQINVIVTSEPDKDPHLTTFIRTFLFDNSAYVLFLDLQDHNIKYKYFFLHLLNNTNRTVKYFFVDQAIITGTAYYTAKSQMASILNDPNFKFDSVITIINRLSKTKYEEIYNDLKKEKTNIDNVNDNPSHPKGKKIHSFLHFHIPPSKVGDGNCYICNMESFFENLMDNSVITDCRSIIDLNRRKYVKKEFDLAKEEESKREDCSSNNNTNRFYSRMIWQNRLFFKISNAIVEKPNIKSREDAVREKINELHEQSIENIDDHISFIKAISTPPLSDFARIRYIAFRILLKDLDVVLKKKSPKIDDLYLVKVLLRHLALLESNALVRKRVITGVWELYSKVKAQLYSEIQEIRSSIRELENPQKTDVYGQAKLPFNESLILALKRKLAEIYNYIRNKEIDNDTLNDDELRLYIDDNNNKLNQFPNYLLFYIKIATHRDPSKSLWLGELLRTGSEMSVSSFDHTFNVSKTKLYNDFFEQESVGTNNIFLPYVYYENTTIIRKTLDSFNKHGDFSRVNENIIYEYKEIIKHNYSYHWFKWYFPVLERGDNRYGVVHKERDKAIDNGVSIEGINLVEKIGLVLRARKFLENHSDPKRIDIDTFDKNADRLLEIFANIMDAQTAYITIRYKPNDYQTLSIYNVNGMPSVKSDDITYDDSYYCVKLLNNNVAQSSDVVINRRRPFVMRKILKENGYLYGESLNRFKSAAYLTLNLVTEIQKNGGYKEYKDNTVGLITFLFEKDESHAQFIRRTQELGRLLLLLKPQLDDYVKHVNHEKIFDVWVEKSKYHTYLTKINFTSGHRFTPINYSFESLSEDEIDKVYGEFFLMSNSVMSFIFSLLLENHDKDNPISFSTNKCTISSLFDSKFQKMLKTLNNREWSDIWDEKINNDKYDVQISINPVIFRYFIVQCFNNAYIHSGCGRGELRIIFNRDGLIIQNRITQIPTQEDIKRFDEKYNIDTINRRIKNQDIKEYGLTLISLIKYCESHGSKCIPRYDVENMLFKVAIYY